MLNAPLQTRLVFGDAPDGAPIASVLAKATYLLTPSGLVAPTSDDQIVPLWEHPVLEQGVNPLQSPLLHASDLVAYQPYCNVVVHGEACAPQGKRARFFDMGISVGPYMKKLRIFGKRFVDSSNGKIRFSDPEPFDRVPLKSDLAFGGRDHLSRPGQVVTHPKNPFGKGFWMDPEPTSIHGTELPCLEDPNRLLNPQQFFLHDLENIEDFPQPAFLGEPPVAHPETLGFVIPYVRSGETVTLAYMDAECPQYSFSLPNMTPKLQMDFGDCRCQVEAFLQKIEIDKSQGFITLLWRGSSYCAPPEQLIACPRMDVFADFGESEDE